MRNVALVLTLLAVLLALPANASARSIPMQWNGHTLKLTKAQAKHLHAGDVLHANVYPVDGGGGLPYPPIPCARYLDGLLMVWGGVVFECFCPAPQTGVCEWRAVDESPYDPNGTVLRPPNPWSVCAG